jgi:hypothetical protein
LAEELPFKAIKIHDDHGVERRRAARRVIEHYDYGRFTARAVRAVMDCAELLMQAVTVLPEAD